MVMKIRIHKCSIIENFGIQSIQLEENDINVLSKENEESKDNNCIEVNTVNDNLNKETNSILLENCIDLEFSSGESSCNLSNGLNLEPNENDNN